MSGWIRVSVLLLSLLPGCFLDRSPLGTVQDAAVGCGQCPAGQVCVDGRCRPSVADADGDGVPAGEDCDDADAVVGSTAERPCTSACASGVERCEGGAWGACDAPAECTCTPGDTRMTSCTMCGLQRQRCEDGTWTDEGACTHQGECTAGADEAETQACGLCSEGTQTRTRTCSPECAWSEWSEWGPCMDATGVCPAGVSETETRPCGACGGMQSRTRTCNATCGWGAWSEWGACDESGAVCMPGQTENEMEPCPCGGGMRRRTRTCTATCGWGAWSDWSACASGECMPGTTETGPATLCGDCGAQTPTRTCTASCMWGDWVPGECRETRCTGTCACRSFWEWTCCPDGDWSGWGDSCAGCP